MAEDRHGEPKTTFRPPAEVKAAAQRAIADNDAWTLNEVLVACLIALADDAPTFLARLERHRPSRKRGRPPKSAQP